MPPLNKPVQNGHVEVAQIANNQVVLIDICGSFVCVGCIVTVLRQLR